MPAEAQRTLVDFDRSSGAGLLPALRSGGKEKNIAVHWTLANSVTLPRSNDEESEESAIGSEPAQAVQELVKAMKRIRVDSSSSRLAHRPSANRYWWAMPKDPSIESRMLQLELHEFVVGSCAFPPRVSADERWM